VRGAWKGTALSAPPPSRTRIPTMALMLSLPSIRILVNQCPELAFDNPATLGQISKANVILSHASTRLYELRC
jgi:hypothetical protein